MGWMDIIFGKGDGNDDARNRMNQNGQGASEFTGIAQGNYNQGTRDLGQSADYLRDVASGKHSVSAEQLRQGLQQNVNAQTSMAAGAAPRDQAMAARTAMIQSGRLASGLAGQQAVAGLQERSQAQQALGQMLLQKRQQDLSGTLGGYGATTQAFGGTIDPNADKSWYDKYGAPVLGAAAGAATTAAMGPSPAPKAK